MPLSHVGRKVAIQACVFAAALMVASVGSDAAAQQNRFQVQILAEGTGAELGLLAPGFFTPGFFIPDQRGGLQFVPGGPLTLAEFNAIALQPAPQQVPSPLFDQRQPSIFPERDGMHVLQSRNRGIVTATTTIVPTTEGLFIGRDGFVTGVQPMATPVGPFVTTQQIIGQAQATQPFVDRQMIARQFNQAVFTGASFAQTPAGTRLFVANFGQGRIDVFNASLRRIDARSRFQDPRIPRDFAPFAVVATGNRIFVSFVRRADIGGDRLRVGLHGGFVDVFDRRGTLVRRIDGRGRFAAPQSLALAPRNFGPFGGTLLVGNFGDGRINVFDRRTGRFVDTLRDRQGRPIVIQGLQNLQFGTGAQRHTLFFTASAPDGQRVVLGSITPI